MDGVFLYKVVEHPESDCVWVEKMGTVLMDPLVIVHGEDMLLQDANKMCQRIKLQRENESAKK